MIQVRRPHQVTDDQLPVEHRQVGEFSDVEPLLALCGDGRLYEVESWIGAGNPIQFAPPKDRKLLRKSTPLGIAVSQRFHSLAALLLANGYDPDGDHYEHLSTAVRGKDHGMVDLLLRYGANPNYADFCDVLETCDRALMDRFIAAGADPCKGNAVARALHFKGRPILGFIKQYRERFPCLQRQIDIALHAFTEREDLRGIALMLWLGANPHAETPDSAYNDELSVCGSTAFESSLWARNPEILPLFLKKPIPQDKAQHLLGVAAYRKSPEIVSRLLDRGADPNFLGPEGFPVLYGFISAMLWGFGGRTPDEFRRGLDALEVILKAGAKWSLDERQVKSLRRRLVKSEGETVRQVVGLLKRHEAIPEDRILELTRTPAIRKILNVSECIAQNSHPSIATLPPRANDQPFVGSRRPYPRRHWSQR